MTRVEFPPPADAGSEAAGCEPLAAAAPAAPTTPADLTVRTIWQREYADGWAQGRAQALDTLWVREPRHDSGPEPPDADTSFVQRAYQRFVDSVGRAPLADFDRFVAEHAFWTGHQDAYQAVLDQNTVLGATAAERGRLPGLVNQILARARYMATRTLHRAELYPGLAIAAALGALALVAAKGEELFFGAAIFEPLVLALLFGVVARNLLARTHDPEHRLNPAVYAAGTGFAAKPILELAVGLLGASVDLRQMIAAGPALLLLIVTCVVLALIVSYTAGRFMGLGSRLATLVAVGNSICGNAAIAAVAPVVRADKREIASAIALTAVLGVGLVLTLPLLVPLLGLNHYQYGVLAGMSVYAVPQVVAAAFPVSLLSGEVAVFVKLGRVALLGPVVIAIALLYKIGRSRTGDTVDGARSSWRTYLPWFLLMFFGLGALRTLDLLPAAVAQPTRVLSYGLTIIAMAGLGFGVEIAAVRRVGARIAAVVGFSLVFMAAAALFLMHSLNVTGAEHAQAVHLAPHCMPGERPEFVLGFRALKTQLGAVMGAPLECVHTTSHGDSMQKTTRGEAYYVLATNTVAFTDGWERYALGADGSLLYWTGTQLDPPPTAQRIPRS